MSLHSIATEYNGPLEAAHAHIDDDRYDKVNCYAASPLKLPHQVSYEAVSSDLQPPSGGTV